MAYDYVIVGAGMFGATLARELTDRGRKVLVIEKRPHTGGMCHTETLEGIPFNKYGPHVFHTNDEELWKYVQRFSEWDPFVCRTKAFYKGEFYSFPINLMTLYQLWGVRTPYEASVVLNALREPIENPQSLEEWALATYGREIYETFLYGYTVKQWGKNPKDLPKSILKRLPLRLTFDDNYFTDRFQAVPRFGYGAFFDRLLDGIEVKLGVDYVDDPVGVRSMGKLIYSGRIDEFYGYCYGELEFRTCRFVTEVYDGDYQGNPVVNYTDIAVPFTRVVEHKHFVRDLHPSKTIVTWEYPKACRRDDPPLYPIEDQKNSALYEKYLAIPTDAIFAGRLGHYRYLDMHQVMAQAISLAKKLT